MNGLLFSDDQLRSVSSGEVVRTVHHDQTKLLMAIMALYGPIEYDATYSEGVFWKDIPAYLQPKYRSDLNDGGDFVADFTALPLDSRSIDGMILDPPFLHGNPNRETAPEGHNIIAKRFSAYRTQADLRVAYHGALAEARRVLKSGSILVFKCQDIVENGIQVWNHCHIWLMATQLGMIMEDIFILVADSRPIGGNHADQKHARKFHSYYLVFRKARGIYAD